MSGGSTMDRSNGSSSSTAVDTLNQALEEHTRHLLERQLEQTKTRLQRQELRQTEMLEAFRQNLKTGQALIQEVITVSTTPATALSG